MECEDCDLEPYTKCLTCAFDDTGLTKTCSECAPGFRLENGKCLECTQSAYCAVCSEDECLECKEGTRMVEGECVSCSASLEHCVSCTSDKICDKCDYHVATLDDSGMCTQCREENNWYKNDVLDKCECLEYVNILDDNKCQTCDDLMPGCMACEQTDNPGDSLFVEIGYDQSISKDVGKYVMCTECGDNMIHD